MPRRSPCCRPTARPSPAAIRSWPAPARTRRSPRPAHLWSASPACLEGGFGVKAAPMPDLPTDRLDHLEPGQAIPFGGDRVARVSDALAAAFQPGDRLIVLQDKGDLL